LGDVGVHGESISGTGVEAVVNNGLGVAGFSGHNGTEGYFLSALYWRGPGQFGHVGIGYGVAGEFFGYVHVAGNLLKAGGGFRIDHPTDPKNRFLCHSFVESPEMKNFYDGTVTLGAGGRATVRLPKWFAALNKNLCYQVSAIGRPQRDLYVMPGSGKASFTIAGGTRGTRVCWQVTGVQNDPVGKSPSDQSGGPQARQRAGTLFAPRAIWRARSLLGLPNPRCKGAAHQGHSSSDSIFKEVAAAQRTIAFSAG
jgi:hypothetical protein